MVRAHGVISADSHVFEPRDLWERYIDPPFRKRAPKIVREGERDLFVIDGLEPEFVGIMGSAGVRAGKLREINRHEEGLRGGWDPHARVRDMDLDGVDAEVLYTSLGMRLHRIQDLPYQLACFRAYNDWLADLCNVYPSQLIGIGLVSLLDVEEGVSELSRIAQKGLRGVGISIDLAGASKPFWDAQYDPFWATAEATETPVSLHVGTFGADRARTPGDFIASYATLPHQVQVSIANLIAYGVFERFPRLKLVSVENDIGWVPTYLERIDHAYERYPHWTGARLSLRPSEYCRRQVFMTFMRDKAGVELRHEIGVDNIMWASDYPHPDSTWPESRRFIEWQMSGIPEGERRKILSDNVTKLYRLT